MQGASARKVVFDPRPILGVLVRHEVRFVVIGGIAASLQGSTTITNDFDICYARDQENLERLVTALTELGAMLRGPQEPVAFRLDARALKAGLNFTFDTKYGPFDCLGEAGGSFDYDQLRRNADAMNLVGTNVSVASLDDLIRMKRAAGRNKDLIEIENLSALREVRDSRRRP
jgi:hypothetical protein